MLRASIILVFSAALSATSVPREQEHESHQGARLTERLGSVRFENTCAPALGEDFDRAVALLHSFEFGAAIDGFEQVLAADSSCAIAYWGIALAYWSNPFGGVRSEAALARGLAAVEQSRAAGTPSERERGYIDAVGALFEDYEAVSQHERIVAYERAMDDLVRRHPEDVEAKIFHALAVIQTALPDDKTYSAQLRAAAILEPLFAKYPDHPGLAHYIIHAYDHPPLATRALDAARRYAEIAPSAPHALHMPSHTFTRVGAWQESVETNRLSEQAAVRQGVVTEALHAMDYQIYALLQMARDEDARDVLERAPAVGATLDSAAVAGGAAPPMAAFYALSAIPARYALERGAWREAADLAVPADGTPFTIAITCFARALGAARDGRPESARADVARLAALRDELEAAQDAYWAKQVDIQRQIASAWVAFAEGRVDEALAQLQQAADKEDATDKSAVTPGPLAPARELLGEMLLEAGRADEALRAFEASMQKEPGRFRGAYGAARAAGAAGLDAEARKHYARLVEIAGDGSTRPELERARVYLAGSAAVRE